MADRGSAKQFVQMLRQASPLDVLKLIDFGCFLRVSRGLDQVAECLDYTQRLVNIVGDKSALNPVMSAVSEAFTRRRISGRFENQSVKIDTLLHVSTKGRNDDDAKVAQSSSNKVDRKENADQICFLFQKNRCTFRNCRYRHECNLCNSTAHGMIDCRRRTLSNGRRTATESGPSDEEPSRRPPHPRFRRDRARNRRQ